MAQAGDSSRVVVVVAAPHRDIFRVVVADTVRIVSQAPRGVSRLSGACASRSVALASFRAAWVRFGGVRRARHGVLASVARGWTVRGASRAGGRASRDVVVLRGARRRALAPRA